MNWILFLWLLLLGSIVIGECFDLPGGESQSIAGQNSIGTGTASGQPVFKYPKGSFSAGDASNYVVPQVFLPKPTRESQTSATNNINGNVTVSPQMAFDMRSNVTGIGSFATRNYLDMNEYDNKAYQLTSAKFGNLTQSRELSFLKDSAASSTDLGTFSYALSQLGVQDSTSFVGLSYNDIAKFKNNKDFIQDVTRTGAISRASVYRSQSLKVDDEDENRSREMLLVNDYTAYGVDTRFVGSSDLHAITNGTEIMQSYIGQIALNRKISSQFMANDTFLDEPWLPCCNSPFIFYL
jgi:hypothetical protein